MPTSSTTSNAPTRFIVEQPGFDTEYGIKGLGYSPDGGKTFLVQDTTDGRVYRPIDAKRLAPFLKPYVLSWTGGSATDPDHPGTVTQSIHWADILDRPELATQADLKKIELTPGPPGTPGTNGTDGASFYYSKWEYSPNSTNNPEDLAPGKPHVGDHVMVPSGKVYRIEAVQDDGYFKIGSVVTDLKGAKGDQGKPAKDVNLDDYAKKTDLDSYALKTQIPSLDGYAKLTNIPSLTGYLKQADLDGYAKKADMPSLADYAKKTDLPAPVDLTGYAKKSDIPMDLVHTDELTAVEDKASQALSTATKAQTTAEDNAKALATKADQSAIPDISVFATQATVNKVKTTADSAKSIAQQAQSTAVDASSKADQAITLANDAKPKIDSTSQTTNKKPSEYSEGFYREVKDVSAIGIVRPSADFAPEGRQGTTAFVTTMSYGGMAHQTADIVDSEKPMRFCRNGKGNTWYRWEWSTTD